METLFGGSKTPGVQIMKTKRGQVESKVKERASDRKRLTRDLTRRVGERADIFRETSETSLEKLVKHVSLETLGRPMGEHTPEGQRG